MYQIIRLIYIMIILYYINCSACSQNTVYSNDKSCSSLSVDDEKTQICIKNPSSFGCKQITSCEQATYVIGMRNV